MYLRAMPRASWCRPEIYEFFDTWRRTCLIDDGAIFSSGSVWTEQHLNDLQTTLGAEHTGAGTFFDKLRDQLAGHEPSVRQLGIEITYVESIGENDTNGSTKRNNLGALADLLPDGVTIDAHHLEILDGGIASYGPGKAYRDAYVRFILRLARRAKQAVEADGSGALEDPWRFRDLVNSTRTSTEGLQANAVLHACFPDHFDVMISSRHRDRLLRAFSGASEVADAGDEEHKLLAVRHILSTRLPFTVEEPYDDVVRRVWDNPARPEWDELIAATESRLPPPGSENVVAAGLPEPDPDLLEDLQRNLGESSSWDDLLREAAVRVVARGGAVTDWGDFREALRQGLNDLPGPTAPPPPDGVVDGEQPALPPVSPALADELFMSQTWLQRLLDQLAARRQLVLYGPPGTGKTWLARRLAKHAFDEADVRLVQFHPSYAYEDFVEGYRPVTEDGRLTYRIVHGPLRELSASAQANPSRPHLLIVDEINRGNLPKVFGELYFLLEYRNQPIRLQYSGDAEFRLPPNLFVIGTMNTADRSIALLDAALRRRFAFVRLAPDEEPVASVLKQWLERKAFDPEPHILLDTLNALLLEADQDRDMAIGPSYFMKEPQPDLELVWEYDIQPLLEERFNGTEIDVRAKFGLEAVRAEAARRADTGEATAAS